MMGKWSARGRNNWFVPRAVFLSTFKEGKEAMALIEIMSIRMADANQSPIVIRGNRSAVISLLEKAVSSLKKMELEDSDRIAIPSGVPREDLISDNDTEKIRTIRIGDENLG